MIGVLVGLVGGAGACSGPISGPLVERTGEETAWEILTVQAMQQARSAAGVSYLRAVTGERLEIGAFHRRAGDTGGLVTHSVDAVYQVVGGEAVLDLEGEEHPLAWGTLAWVRGGTEHRIISGAEALEAVVVLAGSASGSTGTDVEVFPYETLVANRNSEENVFTTVLEVPTFALGTYLLPKNSSEPIQRHDYDEVKLFLTGGGRLDVGSGGDEAAPGTLAWIPRGTPHQLRRTSDAVDMVVIAAR